LQALGVIILDAPHGDLNECTSSSYGLSLFSSTGGSRGGEDAGTKPGGSTIISIGGLWPKIDQLDEVDPRNLSLPTTGN
jgi:hypothetical protein